MTKRFVLEGEQTEEEIGLGYIAAGLGVVVLACLIAVLIKRRAPSHEIAAAIFAAGVVAAFAHYLADLQSRVILILGDDGFTMHANRRPTIFVSHSAITCVEVFEKGFVEVERTDGTTLAFQARPKAPFKSRQHRAHQVMAVIDDARDWYRAQEKQRVDEPLLHSSGRRALDLVRDLKSLTETKVETYRSAPLDRERLWRVAENPSTTASDRVAAFIALRVDAGGEDLARLRNSLDRAADDAMRARLRIAIDSSDDAELASVLELQDEEEGAALSLPQRIRRRRAI